MNSNMWGDYGQWPNTDSFNKENQRNGDRWGKKKIEDKTPLKHSKDEDRKYKSLKTYMRDILKSSLITSIPEITVTKSRTKKVIKIIVFLVCLVGFIYQTLNFLDLYLAYPTVVNVLISNPFEIVAPGITICNRNRQKRSVVCRSGGQCSFMEEDIYCDIYPRNCPSHTKPYTGVPFVNFMIQSWYDWEDEVMEAHNETMISMCQKIIEGKPQICETPYRAVPVVTPTGEPNVCYSLESLWEKPDREPEVYPNTFTIELEINTEPEEYITYTEPVLIQIAVHNRRKIVNPYSEGTSLKGGVKYEATVSMTEKKLLPAPYDTNCTDYLALWKANNGSGPLNDLMCIEFCKLNTLVENGTCIDKNVAYPHMYELCERETISTTMDIIENCTKSCGSPCNDYSYEVRYEEVNNYDHVCLDEWCKKSKVMLTMYFAQFRLTKFLYQPKFESVEMFSYIGGYMGMWLGLSLISLFDFFETISYLLYYPVGHLRWKMRRKRTKPSMISQMRNSYMHPKIY